MILFMTGSTVVDSQTENLAIIKAFNKEYTHCCVSSVEIKLFREIRQFKDDKRWNVKFQQKDDIYDIGTTKLRNKEEILDHYRTAISCPSNFNKGLFDAILKILKEK